MEQAIKTILIADDHPIFRQGVRAIINAIPWISIVGEAETGSSALAQIKHLQPDMVLLDLEMPGMDGLSVLHELNSMKTGSKIIILTSYNDEAYLKRSLDLGAAAFIIKDEAGDELLSCLKAVNADMTYISPSLGSRTLISPEKTNDEKTNDEKHLLNTLTEMELKTLTGVAEFKTSKEIARELGISYRTVQNHRANICSKLGLKGPHQLLQFAKDNL